MEYKRLLGDEVTYELLIRNYPIEGTVAQKRSLLSEALRLEREGEREPPTSVTLDSNAEMITCECKLSDLSEDIDNFNEANKHNEFKRIYSRLIHLTLRLERLSCDSGTIEKCSYLKSVCKELETKVKHIYNNLNTVSAERSILDEPNILLPKVLHRSNRDNTIEHIVSFASHDGSEISEVGDARQVSINPITSTNTVLSVDRGLSRVSTLRNFFESTNDLGGGGNPPRVPIISTCTSAASYQNERHIQTTCVGSSYTPSLLPVYTQSSFPLPTLSHAAYGEPISSNIENLTLNTFSLGQTSFNSLRANPSIYSSGNRPQNYQLAGDNPINYRSPAVPQSELSDISRWPVKFDGVGSVTSFLERIEELRVSRGVSKERLLRSAAELFTKDALLWFRMSQFSSWEELMQKLRVDFQPYDYENALWEEIRHRTQGAQEKVIIFVSVMENLFRKLSVFPLESARIQIIKRNFLPYIQRQLTTHSINSIHDLIQIAKMIEETEVRTQRFCPPPVTTRQLVEPELAYRKPSNPIFSVSSNDNTTPIFEIARSIGCFNCGEAGHKFRKCGKPRKVFCFRCGKPNTVSTSCCAKNARTPPQ